MKAKRQFVILSDAVSNPLINTRRDGQWDYRPISQQNIHKLRAKLEGTDYQTAKARNFADFVAKPQSATQAGH